MLEYADYRSFGLTNTTLAHVEVIRHYGAPEEQRHTYTIPLRRQGFSAIGEIEIPEESP